MPHLIIADNQEITRAGILQIMGQSATIKYLIVGNNHELIAALNAQPKSVVVLDYSLFDIPDITSLFLLETRFPQSQWILFSQELRDDFMKQIYLNTKNFSILFKDSSKEELLLAWHEIERGHRYISSVVSTLLLENAYKDQDVKLNLTATEKRILIDIATGKTTKEIATQRYISIHTVVTHRKNIFRKIQVNNIHEATKYAVKAGLIDLVDYFI